MLYPLKFKPILKEKIWGVESWNIAAHKNGMSVVSNGPLKGKTLGELIELYGDNLLGEVMNQQNIAKFPLLIKLLDTADILSVQVHPDDNYAAIYEIGELGKTEMWYIIDAEPEATIVYGIEPYTTRDEFEKAIQEGNLEKYLKWLEVESGDVVYMPAGMVHAIGAGILLCEIQQNSDTTYRVYDWNRVDENGRPRDLHVKKALDVIDFEGKYDRSKLEGLTVYKGTNSITHYIATKHFAIEKLEIDDGLNDYTDDSKFYILTAVKGSGHIKYCDGMVEFDGGESILIPASLGDYVIEGDCILIKAYIPEVEKDIVTPLLDSGVTVEELSEIVGISEHYMG